MKTTRTENTLFIDKIFDNIDYKIYGRTRVEVKIIEFKILENGN